MTARNTNSIKNQLSEDATGDDQQQKATNSSSLKYFEDLAGNIMPCSDVNDFSGGLIFTDDQITECHHALPATDLTDSLNLSSEKNNMSKQDLLQELLLLSSSSGSTEEQESDMDTYLEQLFDDMADETCRPKDCFEMHMFRISSNTDDKVNERDNNLNRLSGVSVRNARVNHKRTRSGKHRGYSD